MRTGRRGAFRALACGVLVVGVVSPPAFASDAIVSVGSPPDMTPRNHQNEPSVAIDANQPLLAVAGWNDSVDRAPCPQALALQIGNCNPGVPIGISAVGFSFDGGKSWTQPAYTGLTAADCDPTVACTPHVGPIHTLPWYYESGLVSSGDPAVTIGPVPVDGHFSWANGTRVYYANLVAGDPGGFPNRTFHGADAAAVSRLDDPTPQSVLEKSSWKRPVIVAPRRGQAGFQDKEQIWADNAATSHYFGRVYECHSDFRSNGVAVGTPLTPYVSYSRDGGDTWTTKQTTATNGGSDGTNEYGLEGCTIRTDSDGVVYVLWRQFQDAGLVGLPIHPAIVLQKSLDGGRSWTRPRVVQRTGGPFFIDPVSGRYVMDGYAGARIEFGTAPSIDVANGAPTGADATDEIVLAWADSGAVVNGDTMQFMWSRNGGGSWAGPTAVSLPGDRPLYAAAAISPDGDRAYAVYEAVTSPWRGADMNSPRPYHGVFLTAPLAANGAPGTWSTVYEGSDDASAGHNDVRGTFPGHDLYQERVGDYVYAAAGRTYGLGVWIDERSATVCDPIQQWRADSLAAGHRVSPAPWPLADCPDTFGNTDVWSATSG